MRLARKASRQGVLAMATLVCCALASILLSLRIGAYPLHWDAMLALLSPDWSLASTADIDIVKTLVFGIRLPRILAAFLIGSGLSVAGTAYQGLFRNSLVSPDILGASSGAAMGAAIGLLVGLPILGVQSLAFCTGLAAVLFTVTMSRAAGGGSDNLRLVLTGMVTGSVAVAGISVIKTIADPYDSLPSITFWLMGSLSGLQWEDLAILTPPILVGISILLLLRWKLNAMSFNEEEAKTIGVSTTHIRILTLLSATLISSVAVAVAGMIGWIGLLIPHMCRFWIGPNHRTLLPVSVLAGGIFLVWTDNFARAAFQMECPLSVVTCVCGAPVFLMLLKRSGKGWAS
jgi:iron complex transport system permease protein